MKNKSIVLSWILFFLFAFAVLTFPVPTGVFAEGAEETGNLSRLVTSNNPDFYSVIETSGDSITARGVYKNDRPISAGIGGVTASVSFRAENDGSYTAEIAYKPLSSAYYNFYVKLESGVYLTYIMKYTDGWYFPDNGLEVINAQRVEKAYQAEPIASAYYISADADREEIELTLDMLKGIVEDVCGDETDDYRKAYLLNRWIADNIYYDHDAADTSVTLETVAIYNVLTKRRTTCAGFANTYSALLEIAGIRSVNLKGAAVAGEITYDTLTTGTENHEFSAFWYEEQSRWVYVDACWSGAGDYQRGTWIEGITYDKYFDITGEAFALNHRVDKAEERHYTKALEAVDSGETKAPEDESNDETEEVGVSTDEDADPVEFSADRTSSYGADNGREKNQQSIVPVIIIGLAGVLIIGVGIILAVNNRKK